jgi:hypothetical protein
MGVRRTITGLSVAAMLAACGGAVTSALSTGARSTPDGGASSSTAQSSSGTSTAQSSSGTSTAAESGSRGPRDAGTNPATSDATSPAPQDAAIDSPTLLDGGSVPTTGCTQTPVNFVMRSASVDAGYWYEISLSIPGDGAWWYSLADADGGSLSIFPTEQTCGACVPAIIAIGAACGPLSEAGARATWDGTIVTGTSSCTWSPGGAEPPESISCNTTRCAQPGRYVVKMCAQKTAPCFSAPPDTCIDVPFDYPPSSDVVGTLP